MTGAARGIGAATTARLVAAGLVVVAVDIDGGTLTERWEGWPDVHRLTGDVADPATAEAAVAAAVAGGALRVLVNNAGIVVDRAFAAQADDEWTAVHRAVVDGTRTMTAAVVQRMCADAAAELSTGPDARPAPRRIISTIPATTVTGTAGGSASAAAGGAVQALTRTLAREVGGYGIRVNAVMIGYVSTRLTRPLPANGVGPGLPEPVRQIVAATTALGRFGTVEEVAAVHAFLASDAADYVTGAVIPVTGGLLGT